MKQNVPTPDDIERMLYEIYRIMDGTFNPCCRKCHTKITTCECEAGEKKGRDVV